MSMICKGIIVGYADITSKSGDKFTKLWVKVPPSVGTHGEQYAETIIPSAVVNGVDPLGCEAVVSVDRFGRLNDIQI